MIIKEILLLPDRDRLVAESTLNVFINNPNFSLRILAIRISQNEIQSCYGVTKYFLESRLKVAIFSTILDSKVTFGKIDEGCKELPI